MRERVCPGCDMKVVYIQRHHWPYRTSAPDGEFLEHAIYLCNRCNNVLGKLFPRMGDVPWEVQRSALDAYYHKQRVAVRARHRLTKESMNDQRLRAALAKRTK